MSHVAGNLSLHAAFLAGRCRDLWKNFDIYYYGSSLVGHLTCKNPPRNDLQSVSTPSVIPAHFYGMLLHYHAKSNFELCHIIQIAMSRTRGVPQSAVVVIQVPTLTNEGGCLKRDRRLQQGLDYEIVPESLWKALALWYGKGTFALPRTVRHFKLIFCVCRWQSLLTVIWFCIAMAMSH